MTDNIKQLFGRDDQRISVERQIALETNPAKLSDLNVALARVEAAELRSKLVISEIAKCLNEGIDDATSTG